MDTFASSTFSVVKRAIYPGLESCEMGYSSEQAPPASTESFEMGCSS